MNLFGIFFFPFFGLGFVMYFLPSLIALLRSKRDLLSIALLNFFLGWTLIGWVVSLVWALKADVVVVYRPQG
jgi:Superinfection immunity protein